MNISIIIPVYNEVQYISDLLESVFNQSNFDNVLEILIADGGSNDGTKEIIDKYILKYPIIKIIHNPFKIVSVGFNKALNISRGKYILRIDGHCRLSASYIEDCLKLINKKNIDIAGGTIKTISNGKIGKAISIAQSSYFGVGNAKFRIASGSKFEYVDTIAFGIHKRTIFSEIGGYDEDMVVNQDDEFNHRAIQANKKILLDYSICTEYFSRSNYWGLFKQYFKYGCYKIRGIQKRRQLISLRHIVPLLFLLSLFTSLIIGFIYNNILIMSSILIIYSIANFFSCLALSKRITLIPNIYLSYWVIHFGYGLGFIFGILRFINMWKKTSLNDRHFIRKQFNTNNPDNLE